MARTRPARGSAFWPTCCGHRGATGSPPALCRRASSAVTFLPASTVLGRGQVLAACGSSTGEAPAIRLRRPSALRAGWASTCSGNNAVSWEIAGTLESVSPEAVRSSRLLAAASSSSRDGVGSLHTHRGGDTEVYQDRGADPIEDPGHPGAAQPGDGPSHCERQRDQPYERDGGVDRSQGEDCWQGGHVWRHELRHDRQKEQANLRV